jgi:hypothetical protein
MKHLRDMNEKQLEKKLREAVSQKGGIALKFTSPNCCGVPDRIILMPGGVLRFAELKSPGRKPAPLQQAFMAKLQSLGFSVCVIDSQAALLQFLAQL